MTHLFLFSLSGLAHKWDGLLLVLFIGAVAGILAGLIVRSNGSGFITTILLGIAGGWLGNKLFQNYINFTHHWTYDTIIRATIGAIILAVVINLILKAIRGKDKSHDHTSYRS